MSTSPDDDAAVLTAAYGAEGRRARDRRLRRLTSEALWAWSALFFALFFLGVRDHGLTLALDVACAAAAFIRAAWLGWRLSGLERDRTF